jgi:hypothetical protein
LDRPSPEVAEPLWDLDDDLDRRELERLGSLALARSRYHLDQHRYLDSRFAQLDPFRDAVGRLDIDDQH